MHFRLSFSLPPFFLFWKQSTECIWSETKYVTLWFCSHRPRSRHLKTGRRSFGRKHGCVVTGWQEDQRLVLTSETVNERTGFLSPASLHSFLPPSLPPSLPPFHPLFFYACSLNSLPHNHLSLGQESRFWQLLASAFPATLAGSTDCPHLTGRHPAVSGEQCWARTMSTAITCTAYTPSPPRSVDILALLNITNSVLYAWNLMAPFFSSCDIMQTLHIK